MKPQREIASFMVRFTQDLWQDPQGEPRIEWRGQIQRIQDGETLRFTDLAEAVSFIKDSLLTLTLRCCPKDDQSYQEKAMQESFRLWERFAQNYTSMIVEAMQRTAPPVSLPNGQAPVSGEPVRSPQWRMTAAPCPPEPAGPVEAAHGAVQSAMPSAEQLLPVMMALQAQVKLLTAKVAQLEETINTQR
jgi:hypothetical protein